jgi:hypothetical protein
MTWIQKMSLLWLAAASLASAIPQPASAGAWAQPKGHLYTKLSSVFYRSDEVFDDAGHRQPTTIYGADFRADQGFLYVEYGLLERLTVITQLSGASLESENNIRHNVLRLTTSGLGDFLVGAKYPLVSKPVVLSSYVNVKIPTNYDDDLNPALGTGDMDVEVRLLAARSFYPLPVYVGAEAGYRLRGGPFSNQIGFSGEIGATPLSRLSIKAYLENSRTLSGNARLAEPGLVQVSEGDFTKLSLITGLRVSGPLWLEASLESVLSGENVSAGHSWGLGISYSY